MPRKARLHSVTGIYHIMLRGLNGQDLFRGDDDYIFFLRRLFQLSHPKDAKGEPMEPFCSIYAYCLMSNHVHLMLRPEGKELSEVVRSLTVSYARYYNNAISRRGYLFQDRFRSEPVEDFNYLVTLFRYIHQNPLKAGLVSNVDAYRWSSWHEYISSGNVLSICEKSFILDQVDLSHLSTWVRQLLENDDCSHLEEVARPSDEDVRELLTRMLQGDNFQGDNSLGSIANLPKKERDEIIISALQAGAGIRQLGRITGISVGIIQRLKIKNDTKTPSPCNAKTPSPCNE